jgi:hypothetical protein
MMKSMIVWGDCQAHAIALILRDLKSLTKDYEIIYMDVDTPGNSWPYGDPEKFHELIGNCDIFLRQDVWNWEHWPYRDLPNLRGRLLVFPSLSLLGLWPCSGPDPLFYQTNGLVYTDLVMARLRDLVPEKEQRLKAYMALDLPNPPNIEKFCDMCCRQHVADQERLGFTTGQWIVDNFRSERLFHTVVHPVAKTLGVLTDEILTKLELFQGPCNATNDFHLWGNQVPLHPLVIEKLGIKWANAETKFMLGGNQYTCEEWARLYIDTFG